MILGTLNVESYGQNGRNPILLVDRKWEGKSRNLKNVTKMIENHAVQSNGKQFGQEALCGNGALEQFSLCY